MKLSTTRLRSAALAAALMAATVPSLTVPAEAAWGWMAAGAAGAAVGDGEELLGLATAAVVGTALATAPYYGGYYGYGYPYYGYGYGYGGYSYPSYAAYSGYPYYGNGYGG
jgi:hypothetical protein